MNIPVHWVLGRRGNWDHGTMMLAEDGILSPGSGRYIYANRLNASGDRGLFQRQSAGVGRDCQAGSKMPRDRVV